MLDLVLQLGPCRVEPVGRRLLRVRGGSDQPAIVEAIRRAGGERDGTRQFWWIEARSLRSFRRRAAAHHGSAVQHLTAGHRGAFHPTRSPTSLLGVQAERP
jgi:hypothetical protein